jgi:PAS domain S-box-containing protein
LEVFESQETFKDLFDNAHDLIHLVHLDGTLLYVNNAWTRVLQYSQEEVKGKSVYDFIDRQDRNLFIDYRNKVINGTTFTKEISVRFISKTGKKIWLEGLVSVKINDDKPQYTRGIFRDITSKLENEAQLKQVYDELKERQENLQRLLHYAPDAVIVIDAQSQILFWNPKAEEIFGWISNEVLNKSLTDIIIPMHYRKAHAEGMKRFLSTGEAHVLNKTIEITALRKGGEEFYVSLTISTTQQNGKTAFIAFIRDIDKQKRNALELEQKKKELETSNQELEQFAHVASHDMKEPIRKINILTDILLTNENSNFSSNEKIHLEKIQNAASRLTKMVDGVLTYSTLKSEEYIFEKVDLNNMISSVVEDLELLIEEKKAVIKFEKLPELIGANFLIYQLFYNLINNALKFSLPDVPPLIIIKSEDLSEQDIRNNNLNEDISYTEITLEDNGIGFSQEYAEKIFKTFFRLHAKQIYEGTGLGLSLCKNIVDKHHGIINAEGREGMGARFTIILPLQKN